MRTATSIPALLGLLALLAGCGGGGGAAAQGPAEPELFVLSDDRLTLQPRTITYRVSGEVTIDGQEPLPISGSARILQAQPETIAGGLCATLETQEILDGDAPLLTRVFSRREEESNVSLRTGQLLSDGARVTWKSAYPQGPLRYLPGEQWSQKTTNLGFASGSASPRLVLEQSSWTVDRVGIIDVPAGRFECYVIYSTERLHDAVTDTTEVTSRITFMRPALGVIQSTAHIHRQQGDTSFAYTLTHEAESVH